MTPINAKPDSSCVNCPVVFLLLSVIQERFDLLCGFLGFGVEYALDLSAVAGCGVLRNEM